MNAVTRIHISAGIAGSGKSTWFANNFDLNSDSVVLISRDLARLKLTGDMENHDCEMRVTDYTHCQYVEAIKNPNVANVLVDTTAVRYKDRKDFYKLAENSGCPVEFHLVVFKNFDEAAIQNQQRDRVVPDDAMERMRNRFDAPKKEDILRCASVIEIIRVQRPSESIITYYEK